MGHWLAAPGAAKTLGWVKRFDARYWTVNFPRPMMAAAVTTGPDALRVEAVFYRKDDLAGLIWEAEDRWDHPLLRYETSKDFRTSILRFRWQSSGVKPIDTPHGSLGGTLQLLANGIGDDPAGVAAELIIEGSAQRPPSPVHLTGRATGAGDVAISWVRRSRQGWSWTSGSDTPLGEEREAYRLSLSGTGFARLVECESPAFLYTAADQAVDGAVLPIQIAVEQIGTFAASRPAHLTLS